MMVNPAEINEGVTSGRSAKPSMQTEYSCSCAGSPELVMLVSKSYSYWSRSDGCQLGLQVWGRYWLLVGRRC